MKKFSVLTILSLFASVSAFAAVAEAPGEVVLNSNRVYVDASTATLVRTASTPKVVKVFMKVPMGHRVCEEYGTRMVFGRHPSCGYDVILRRVTQTYCIQYGRTPSGGTRCVRWGRRVVTRPVNVMRACQYPVQYCVRYGTSTFFETRKVKLVFKKAAKLSGSEQETFLLSGDQVATGSSDADFVLSPLDTRATYTMKTSDFLGSDRIKVKKTSDEPMSEDSSEETTIEVVQ